MQRPGPDHHRGGECGRIAPSRAKPTSCCPPMRGRRSASRRPRPSPASLRRWPRSPSRRARRAARLSEGDEKRLCAALLETPRHIAEFLKQEAKDQSAGRGNRQGAATCSIWAGAPSFPLALEGALKLKEISYIHAEGYAAGEMKHGPIALIDEEVPIIVIAPHDAHFEKTISNMQEVMARGRQGAVDLRRARRRRGGHGMGFDHVPDPPIRFIAPLIYAIPGAAARLSRGSRQGHGCGSAAKSGQVGDRRISDCAVTPGL